MSEYAIFLHDLAQQ